MNLPSYRHQKLHLEDNALSDIAERYGTPCYVYSRQHIETSWQAFDQALKGQDHLICYAVKANANLAVLNLLAKLGSGFDIVSIGELERVLHAGGEAKKIIFSGVGKQSHEIIRALETGIYCFNVESLSELEKINHIAGALNVQAPVALRLNPDIDPKTHPYISTGLKSSKFGISSQDALQSCLHAAKLPHIRFIGLDCHIGSQLTEMDPFERAADYLLSLVDTLDEQGITLQHIDIGGGLGVRYHQEQPPSVESYVQTLRQKLANHSLKLVIEPGRSLMANAGLLLTQVITLKPGESKNFAIVDAAMTDLMRPALYQAWHDIKPLKSDTTAEEKVWDIVGPVCESGDFLGQDRTLKLFEGDLLAICSAGAYGFVMSSQYNARPRAAEVMIDGKQTHLIRRREVIEDLWQLESILP
jgi:diaminopimelate decarboxylase